MNIHLTLDREEALKDADFVTTQLRVGFLDARINDEKILLKYGVLGQETTGPGGFMKAQRTIPPCWISVRTWKDGARTAG